MGQVGIPLFYLQELAGARLQFKDNFADGVQHDAWRLFKGELTEVGKHGSESGGVYRLSVDGGVAGQWATSENEAPRLFMGVLTFPCEIVTKLTGFSANNYNRAGLFICGGATTFGAEHHMSIARKRKDSISLNGITVLVNDTEQASYTPAVDLPVWLRIRLFAGGYNCLSADFSYSYDGVNYTVLWTQKTGWSLINVAVVVTGLYAANATGNNAVFGDFDFFKMRPIHKD